MVNIRHPDLERNRRDLESERDQDQDHPEKGGAESNLLGLARYLAGRGHEVVVHTSRRTIQGGLLPERDELGGIKIRRYRPSLRLGYYATLFRPAVRDADVLHLHGYGFLTNDRVVRPARGSIPAVYSLLHGVAQPPPTATARAKRAVYVVSHVDVPPPKKDDVIAALNPLAEGSRKSDGNSRFEVVQQTSRPNHFTVIEAWKGDKAYDARVGAAPQKQFREKLGPMLGALYDERIYRPVD